MRKVPNVFGFPMSENNLSPPQRSFLLSEKKIMTPIMLNNVLEAIKMFAKVGRTFFLDVCPTYRTIGITKEYNNRFLILCCRIFIVFVCKVHIRLIAEKIKKGENIFKKTNIDELIASVFLSFKSRAFLTRKIPIKIQARMMNNKSLEIKTRVGAVGWSGLSHLKKNAYK